MNVVGIRRSFRVDDNTPPVRSLAFRFRPDMGCTGKRKTLCAGSLCA